MGTTRIKVIDLSSEKQEIKTSRKHAEKLTGLAKIKEKKPQKQSAVPTPSQPSETSKPSESSQPSQPSEPVKKATPEKTPVTPRKKLHHLGQKYLRARQLVDRNKLYPPEEAIDLLAKTSITTFDGTVELHLNVAQKNLRGSVNLPHPFKDQKQKRILVFAEQKPQSQTQQIIMGNEKTLDEIVAGKLKPNRDFDMVFSTPKFMPQLAKAAKILGPAGMMPNPKNNTVVENVVSALKSREEAGFEYKTDPTTPVIHTKLGKLSNKPGQIEENLRSLITSIGPAKIKKAVIKSTMSPAIKLDLSTFLRS